MVSEIRLSINLDLGKYISLFPKKEERNPLIIFYLSWRYIFYMLDFSLIYLRFNTFMNEYLNFFSALMIELRVNKF